MSQPYTPVSKVPVHVVGMHPGSLTFSKTVWGLLAEADTIVGSRRLLAAAALAQPPQEMSVMLDGALERITQIPLASPLELTIAKIREEIEAGRKTIVLADGDPLFYGIGRLLLQELGSDALYFHPNRTTLQVAAAKLKMVWQDIKTVSLHGRSAMAPLFSAMVKHDKIAVYTDHINTPGVIAQALLEKGAEGYTMTILEDLETPQEIIRKLSPEEVWDLDFSPLNLIIIERSYPPEFPVSLGAPDSNYLHERGLITKQAVRAVGLSYLNIQPNSVVWDLGSGCGSVAIEASALAYEGQVVAVEQHARRAATIRENIRRMGAWIVDVVRGDLPEALDDQLKDAPTPDRIFIGGGLGGANNAESDLLEKACDRLPHGGRIVLHCILLDTVSKARKYFHAKGWNFGMTQVQVSASKPLAGDLMLTPYNPVFIIWAEKS
ncbi:MAG: precorrin-6y C5,15-methyltransferase (decarboxylating) subunit CbiE [Desulfovibrio sp.]